MALFLEEKPGLIDGSNVMEGIEVSEIDAAVLMSLFEESHYEYCNEEEVNILMESLEAEIGMQANHGSCNIEGNMENNDGFDYFEWIEKEMVPSLPSDEMNWYVEDHVEISVNDLVEFGNEFPQNYYEVPLEHGYSSVWQETYDTAIYN